MLPIPVLKKIIFLNESSIPKWGSMENGFAEINTFLIPSVVMSASISVMRLKFSESLNDLAAPTIILGRVISRPLCGISFPVKANVSSISSERL